MNQAGQEIQNVEIKQTKRDDHGVQLRRQAAATALQQYSVLALHSVRDVETPARTRLKMMCMLTDIPSQPKHYKMRKSSK